MTKEEFKKRWESDSEGSGITFDDIAECAIDWGIFAQPKIHRMHDVAKKVVESAGCKWKE